MTNIEPLSDDERAAFARDGFIVRHGLFSSEEVAALNETVNSDPVIAAKVYGRTDAGGATTELALWRDLGPDMFSDVARSRRVADTMTDLLGGAVDFFHAKLTLKRPKVGGAWDWHQDYGYWYRAGFPYPDMGSVFIALDPSRRENGCLQVIRGSHRMGRIEHGVNEEQVGADMTRVEAALARLELVHVEMDPGDALFFHGNLLHASGRNDSDHTRNVLLCCYSRSDNQPFTDFENAQLTAFEPVADDQLMRYAGAPISREKSFSDGAPAPSA